MSSFIAVEASAVLDRAGLWLSEWGFPVDGDSEVEHERNLRHGHGENGTASTVLESASLSAVVSELVIMNKKRERNARIGLNRAPVIGDLIRINSNNGVHLEGFVLAHVDNSTFSRVWPIHIPHDVVNFCLSGLHPEAYRVRVLSELTRIYCDAVRLFGQGIGVNAVLLASLRDVSAGLRVALSSYCNASADKTDDEATEADG